MPRLTRRTFLGAVGITGMSGCLGLGASGTETMTVGIVPDVDPDTAIEKNRGLADYIEKETESTIELRTTADYAGLVRAMGAEDVDLAYFGGVSYVLAHHRADAEAIIVGEKDGSTQWTSSFITHQSTGLKKIDDVVSSVDDLELVFGDPLSTSGTVMPSYYLQTKYGLGKEQFTSSTHVGAHDATAKAIAGENGDVGALNSRIYDSLREDETIGNEIVELWRTPGFPDYPWAVAPAVGSETVKRIKTAFTSLDENGKTEILDQHSVDRYVETSHKAFETLDTAVEMAGIRTGKTGTERQ